MAIQMILLRKNGDVSQLKTKSTDVASFYKKAGFKSAEGFEHRHTFKVPEKISPTIARVQVYAKDAGRAGMENKTELPPPIDTILFYGSILCVGYDAGDETRDLTEETWGKIYEHIFGGFENLDDTAEADENEEDELEQYPDELKTKHGYLKDRFVVDSGDECDSNDESGEDLSYGEYV